MLIILDIPLTKRKMLIRNSGNLNATPVNGAIGNITNKSQVYPAVILER